jgi:hypothetical protein
MNFYFSSRFDHGHDPMTTTPFLSKKTKFAMAAIPPTLHLALSTKAWSTFNMEVALPTAEELAAFSTDPSEAFDFMKQQLLLAGVLTNLWKDGKTSFLPGHQISN